DRIRVRVRLDGPGRAGARVGVRIPGLRIDAALTADGEGVAEAELPASGIVRWSPEDPRLYYVSLTAGDDRLADRIGFRTPESRAGQVLLNGTPIFLRGISLHAENPLRGGRAHGPEDARLLLGWARELGCNFVRLAHYPHDRYVAALADELGMLLWEEIPV